MIYNILTIFFQAEDGIRDYKVTGVQTCALPISIVTMGWDQAETGMEGDSGELFAATKGAVLAFTRSLALSLAPKIGRASCRERVDRSVGTAPLAIVNEGHCKENRTASDERQNNS